MKVEGIKMENTKKVSKMEVVKGMIAGAVFAIGKNKKNENKNAKVEAIA